MRVCFLLPGLGRSGGVGVVTGHAARLAAAETGIEPEIVLTRGDAQVELPGVPIRKLEEVRGDCYDVAVATWWETAYDLFSINAKCRAVFLQSFEQRFYPAEEHFSRMAASAISSLPVRFMAVSPWICQLLEQLHPGARCVHVPNGIDKSVFADGVRSAHEGPLRVLIEGQPDLWFKGVGEALQAVRKMRQPAELTVVAPDPSSVKMDGVRVVGGLEPTGMRDLYAVSDVLLKLSRVEGLGLGPIEAFHQGVPCIVTPYTGHEDYVRHGENGLVVDFDDQDGTARVLDLLASDRELLQRLSNGALATASDWPDAGKIAIEGRLSPFIELGVGFNPDLNAFDNVVINGTLLGLSPREARRRFDEIIDFAELHDSVEVKLKNYSSGMHVRLAFAVAIQVDADILLIDEVLAVGDAAFQRKCIDEFRRIKRAGQTVLFVTHDMGLVQQFCDRAILLEEGHIHTMGKPAHVSSAYNEVCFKHPGTALTREEGRYGNGDAEILDGWLENEPGEPIKSLQQGARCRFVADIAFHRDIVNPGVGFHVLDANERRIFVVDSQFQPKEGHWLSDPLGHVSAGTAIRVSFEFENLLAAGSYWITLNVHHEGGPPIADERQLFRQFEVTAGLPTGGIVDFPINVSIERSESSKEASAKPCETVPTEARP